MERPPTYPAKLVQTCQTRLWFGSLGKFHIYVNQAKDLFIESPFHGLTLRRAGTWKRHHLEACKCQAWLWEEADEEVPGTTVYEKRRHSGRVKLLKKKVQQGEIDARARWHPTPLGEIRGNCLMSDDNSGTVAVPTREQPLGPSQRMTNRLIQVGPHWATHRNPTLPPEEYVINRWGAGSVREATYCKSGWRQHAWHR